MFLTSFISPVFDIKLFDPVFAPDLGFECVQSAWNSISIATLEYLAKFNSMLCIAVQADHGESVKQISGSGVVTMWHPAGGTVHYGKISGFTQLI